MKFRIAYLYLLIGIGVIITLIFLSQSNNTPGQPPADNIAGKEMPNDDVHKGLTNPLDENPTKSNVSSEVYHKMDVLKKAVESNPGDTSKMREYADFMSAAHKTEDAIPYYEKILKVDPKRNDILFSLALISYNKQDFKKSEEYTNKILTNDKTNTQAMYNLGAIAAEHGRKRESKGHLE